MNGITGTAINIRRNARGHVGLVTANVDPGVLDAFRRLVVKPMMDAHLAMLRMYYEAAARERHEIDRMADDGCPHVRD